MLVVSSTIPHVRHKKLHLLFRADDTNATLQLRWFCSHCSELLLAKVNLDFISTKILRGVRSHNINKCSLLSKYLLCRKISYYSNFFPPIFLESFHHMPVFSVLTDVARCVEKVFRTLDVIWTKTFEKVNIKSIML